MTEDWQRNETGVATSAEAFASLFTHIGKVVPQNQSGARGEKRTGSFERRGWEGLMGSAVVGKGRRTRISE